MPARVVLTPSPGDFKSGSRGFESHRALHRWSKLVFFERGATHQRIQPDWKGTRRVYLVATLLLPRSRVAGYETIRRAFLGGRRLLSAVLGSQTSALTDGHWVAGTTREVLTL
jgi:hypothetical protein